MNRSFDLASVVLALFSCALPERWTGLLERKGLAGACSGGWLLRGCLLAAGLVVAGMGEVRGDLVHLGSPATYVLDQNAYANNSSLGDYNYTGPAPASINNFNSFSSPGFSAGTNASLGYSSTSSATSFEANASFYTAAQATSSIDPNSSASAAYAVTTAEVVLADFTLTQSSLATVTFNANQLLGSNSVNNPQNLPNSEAYLNTILQINGSNGSYAYVEQTLSQQFFDPSTPPTASLIAASDTGSPTNIQTQFSGNQITLLLDPGTYSISAESVTAASFAYSNGSFNYPQQGSGGSVIIDALPTPEPSSLLLFGVGALGLFGTARRPGRNRVA